MSDHDSGAVLQPVPEMPKMTFEERHAEDEAVIKNLMEIFTEALPSEAQSVGGEILDPVEGIRAIRNTILRDVRNEFEKEERWQEESKRRSPSRPTLGHTLVRLGIVKRSLLNRWWPTYPRRGEHIHVNGPAKGGKS